MSYALQAAILIQLDANEGEMLTVKTLAHRLSIDPGLVRDELETLWAFGQVKPTHDPADGTIVGAMALPPPAEATACA
jgi:predicted transcriptional regulator